MANIDFVVGVCLLIGLSTAHGAAVPDPKQPEGRVTELDSAAHPEFGQPPDMPFAQDVADPNQPEGRVTGLDSASHPEFGQPPEIPFAVPDPLQSEGKLIELDSAPHPEFGHAPQIPFAVPDPLQSEGRLIDLDSAAQFAQPPQIPFAVPDPLRPKGRLIDLDSTSHPEFDFGFGVAFTVKSPTVFNRCFIYQEVVTNIGDAYDPGSGYFTAPVQGVYYFSFHTSVVWPRYDAALYRNGEEIVNTPMPGTNSAVLRLHKGDRVNICLVNTFGIERNPSSTFSGFRLLPWLPQ